MYENALKLTTKLALLVVLIALTACASGRAIDDWCLTNKAIRPTQAEIETMSDQTQTDILQHNSYGEKRCGWKKNGKKE